MYLWVKAFHLISIISWMAGLLYLPRLFVYHAAVKPDSAQAKTFIVMEKRLLKVIMNPAMIASLVFGLWLLVLEPTLFKHGWFLIKIIAVALLFFCHIQFAIMRRHLETGISNKSEGYYRIWNEVPTVLMIIIVIMVIVQPF